jgi:dihydroflavonol-4-reductase
LNNRPGWNGVHIVIGDVTKDDGLAEAFQGVDRLYHVAGKVEFNPTPEQIIEMRAVNVDGVRRTLEHALRAGVKRTVHVSSVSTIGGSGSPDRVLSEEDFGRGTGFENPYPLSKYDGEKVALEFQDRLHVTVVNPTFFAGPGDVNLSSARTIVSFMNRQVWVGLDRGGMGYTDVRDIAKGLRLAMEKGRNGERYILGGTNLLLRDYHALLAELTGLTAPGVRVPPFVARPLAVAGKLYYALQGKKSYVGVGDVAMARNYWLYDYSKARNELGLSVMTPRESLRDAIDWLNGEGRNYWK